MKIALVFQSRLRLEVDLLETETTKAIFEALPFDARAQTWGEEVYFATPVKTKLEKDARQLVEPGTVCFWTEGDAIALPYGRTPISTDERPKLASRCNVLGKIVGDPKRLATVKGGETLTVERV
ncbi:MAG TPA: cyclophilin-like fold protein [Burkholderiales bacterium]|nr:cyclophilin-like fold protein [Burkholderiales bacterium]